MEQIRRLEEDAAQRAPAQREQDEATRRMAHAVWVYFDALMAEGFTPTDALDAAQRAPALSWQMMVMTRGEG
jgi:hypothetical protein